MFGTVAELEEKVLHAAQRGLATRENRVLILYIRPKERSGRCAVIAVIIIVREEGDLFFDLVVVHGSNHTNAG